MRVLIICASACILFWLTCYILRHRWPHEITS
jgi:hypothetical protein